MEEEGKREEEGEEVESSERASAFSSAAILCPSALRRARGRERERFVLREQTFFFRACGRRRGWQPTNITNSLLRPPGGGRERKERERERERQSGKTRFFFPFYCFTDFHFLLFTSSGVLLLMRARVTREGGRERETTGRDRERERESSSLETAGERGEPREEKEKAEEVFASPFRPFFLPSLRS